MALLTKFLAEHSEIRYYGEDVVRFKFIMLKLRCELQEEGISPEDVHKIIRHYVLAFRNLFVDTYDPDAPPYLGD